MPPFLNLTDSQRAVLKLISWQDFMDPDAMDHGQEQFIAGFEYMNSHQHIDWDIQRDEEFKAVEDWFYKELSEEFWCKFECMFDPMFICPKDITYRELLEKTNSFIQEALDSDRNDKYSPSKKIPTIEEDRERYQKLFTRELTRKGYTGENLNNIVEMFLDQKPGWRKTYNEIVGIGRRRKE